MSSNKEIEHEGIVRSLREGSMIVEILSKSACSGCTARSLCSSSEQRTKEVEVMRGSRHYYVVGQSVVVVAAESLGRIAVVLCYVAPVVLMLAVMVILSVCGLSDIIVGVAALGVLVPYFAVIYAFRSKFKKKFIFKTKNSNKETWMF